MSQHFLYSLHQLVLLNIFHRIFCSCWKCYVLAWVVLFYHVYKDDEPRGSSLILSKSFSPAFYKITIMYNQDRRVLSSSSIPLYRMFVDDFKVSLSADTAEPMLRTNRKQVQVWPNNCQAQVQVQVPGQVQVRSQVRSKRSKDKGPKTWTWAIH